MKETLIPENMIGPNDAARMIVRSSLLAAPQELQAKYKKFIQPLELEENRRQIFLSSYERETYQKEIKLFDQFYKELLKLQFEKSYKPNLDAVKKQVANVISAAEKYIKLFKLENLREGFIYAQLKTITGNIKSRKVVTNYPNQKKDTSPTEKGTAPEKSESKAESSIFERSYRNQDQTHAEEVEHLLDTKKSKRFYGP